LQKVHIRIFAPKERRFTAWIGGSILSHLPTFSKMWVSAAEYQEEGAGVVSGDCVWRLLWLANNGTTDSPKDILIKRYNSSHFVVVIFLVRTPLQQKRNP
jgi:hypothetical protein